MTAPAQEQIRTASLLGLPPELRLEIYSFVFASDLQHMVLRQWRHTHSAERGFISVPDLNKDEKLIIPWLNLMLSCKTLAVELRAVMQEDAFKNDKQNLTYTLELEATRGGMALGAVTWKKLPCPPSQAQYVEAYYNSACGLQAWGDGGPHGITSGLYQSLNHLIHCGPHFDMKRPLPKTMHIKELRLIVEDRGVPAREQENEHYRRARDTNPLTQLYELGSIVGQINNTGVLRGFVDKIQLSTSDKVLNWSPADVEAGGIPEYWNRYGFDWGTELYRGGENPNARN